MYRHIVNPQIKKGHINPEIQGHFSEHLGRCIYEGIFVGDNSDIPNVNGMRTDVVEALKEMKIPVLRWPGGCFADEYHWMDGIGEKKDRKKMINTNWGGVVEDNSFGTHEFMELCRQLGCKTYVNGNVGSGTVKEMSEWVEYMTFEGVSPMADLRRKNGHDEAWNLDYFAIGNETWGCGGNMSPEYYSDLYRHYQTFVKNYNPDKKIKRLAVGPSDKDYAWTETLLKKCFERAGSWNNAHGFMDGLTLHYYTLPYDWAKKGAATGFNEKEWYMTLRKTLFMEDYIAGHSAIMDRYDPEKQIGLMVDEWGTWYDVEEGTNPGFLYQQNTIRDALVAGINLNIFNKHADRVKMANIAQLVNVLQAVILTEGEKMIKTPTYYVFKMYSAHQDNDLLESFIDTKKVGLEDEYMVPNLTESVSADRSGKIIMTVTNLSLDEEAMVESVILGANIKEVKAQIVKGKMDDHNTFDNPDVVRDEEFKNISFKNDKVRYTIPPCSVMCIEVTA
ncbi:MAG: alpha-N-arabinofuranosidase [Lachnospiraceae bacterium]|nr:alpha-N-arabinofuranosidase [Lachnospiraceae bacterium]